MRLLSYLLVGGAMLASPGCSMPARPSGVSFWKLSGGTATMVTRGYFASDDDELPRPGADPSGGKSSQLEALESAPKGPQDRRDGKNSPGDETGKRADHGIDGTTASSQRLAPELMPIDLPTVVQLVNRNSPLIGFSRARAREAYARAEVAGVLWLPNMTAGTAYNRFDGQTQNQRGEVFSVSRSNLFVNGGFGLNLDTSEAFYRPLIDRRLASAEQSYASAASLDAELDAVLAYLDLLYTHELLEINADTLSKGEALLVAAKNAQAANLDRSPGDVNRVQLEVYVRKQERVDLTGRSAVASARLGRLLLVEPGVRLVPQVTEAVPVTLIDAKTPINRLISMASQNRPELRGDQEVIAAAWERIRKAKYGPLFPKLQVTENSGTFGGGLNGDVQNFGGRNVIAAQVYWELKNLGFGNYIEQREREAGLEQANYRAIERRARVASDVVESAETALAKLDSLQFAGEAVSEADRLYEINREGTFNVIDSKNLFDALRPLQALQFLNQTRQQYLAAVLDYTRAQYRLHAAIGCPCLIDHPSGTPLPLDRPDEMKSLPPPGRSSEELRYEPSESKNGDATETPATEDQDPVVEEKSVEQGAKSKR